MLTLLAQTSWQDVAHTAVYIFGMAAILWAINK